MSSDHCCIQVEEKCLCFTIQLDSSLNHTCTPCTINVLNAPTISDVPIEQYCFLAAAETKDFSCISLFTSAISGSSAFLEFCESFCSTDAMESTDGGKSITGPTTVLCTTQFLLFKNLFGCITPFDSYFDNHQTLKVLKFLRSHVVFWRQQK